jgi:HTH-type transcriptional regulator/antitoxin HigA
MDPYLDLVRECPLRAIRTKAQYAEATQMASRLAIRGEDTLLPGEQDYLDALMVLIEAYDLAQLPWKKTSGVDLVKHLMEQAGMTLEELGKIVGSRPLASLILLGKREMSKQVMRRLGSHFKVEPGVFM